MNKAKKRKVIQKVTSCPCGAEIPFLECHGRQPGISPLNMPQSLGPQMPSLELAPARSLVKLDLACGQSPRDGFEGVDLLAPDPKHRLDLLKFPWPWADNSVDELNCSHFIEHIPMEFVVGGPHDGKDLFFAFFDECWRVLKPGGDMTVICPCARSNRAFQDPTHRRFIVAETFGYLWAQWRKDNKLDHYRVNCNFVTNVVPIIPIELNVLAPEVQARKFNECWNTIWDWSATLKAVK